MWTNAGFRAVPILILQFSAPRRNAATDTSSKSNGKKSDDEKAFPENLFDASETPSVAMTKEDARSKVEELIKGMVLLKVEDEGAWTTLLEWTDVDSLGEYRSISRKYDSNFSDRRLRP